MASSINKWIYLGVFCAAMEIGCAEGYSDSLFTTINPRESIEDAERKIRRPQSRYDGLILMETLVIITIGLQWWKCRKTEKATRNISNRLIAAQEAGKVVPFDWSPNPRKNHWSPAFEELYGFQPGEYDSTYENWMERIHPDDRAHVESEVRKLLKTSSLMMEFRIVKPGGEIRWLQSRGVLKRNGKKEIQQVVGVVLDITEKKIAEEQRIEAQTLHTAVLSSLHDQVAILDSQGYVIAVNKSWSESRIDKDFDVLGSASLGTNYIEACHTIADPDDTCIQSILEGIDAVIHHQKDRFVCEYAFSTLEEKLWFEITVEPLQRSQGGVVITRSNISARKRAEIETQEHRQKLAHLTRVAMIGELSGALAHELNQPLAAILSSAQAVQRYLKRMVELPEPVSELLSTIVEQDKRAGEVIKRLRAMMKKEEPKYELLDANEIITEMLRLTKSNLISQGVTMVTHFAESLPSIEGDRIQLQQVFLNLIMNGCEAMAQTPQPQRNLTIASQLVDNTQVKISVRDMGTGIPEDKIQDIFEPFITTKEEGMGLGLSICQTIVTSHGGSLKAFNNENKGATFELLLPVKT